MIKNKQKEADPQLKRLGKMKRLKKLIMHEKFIPDELLDALKNHVVGDEKPAVW